MKLDLITFDSGLELTGSKSKREYNDKLVISWLKAVRYSNYEIIASLLSIELQSCYRVIKRLINDDLIELFENHEYDKKLICLTRKGAKWHRNHLICVFDDDGNAVVAGKTFSSSKRLKNASTVMHSLGVQKAILRFMNQYSKKFKRISDVSIATEAKVGLIVTDALLTLSIVVDDNNKIQATVAIEYERSRKNKARTHYQMLNHYKNIANKDYAIVAYYFEKEIDYNYYHAKYSEEWGRYTKQKNGKLFPSRSHVPFEKNEEILSKFKFAKPFYA